MPQVPKSNSISHNKHTYIPPHVEKAMAQQLARTMPANMQKYAGAFVEQHRNMPSVMPPNNANPASHPAPKIHNINMGGSELFNNTKQPLVQTAQGAPPELKHSEHFKVPDDQVIAAKAPVNENFTPEQAYDFIFKDQQPVKKTLLPTGSSLPVRIAIFGSILVVLMIAFVFAKGLLGGKSALPEFISIVQDQQELIHIVGSIDSSQTLSTANENFAATAKLSLASSQSELINYLSKNSNKVQTKQINLKVSTTTDNQLKNAQTAGTFDQTFNQVMKSKLTAYMNELHQAYQITPGPKGQALLSNQYDQAKLMLLQLDATKS